MRIALAGFQSAFEREGGVGDDGERVLDLMRELGGEPSSGTQLVLAGCELARLVVREPLFFQQHLEYKQPHPHQHQHDDADHDGFGRTFHPNV